MLSIFLKYTFRTVIVVRSMNIDYGTASAAPHIKRNTSSLLSLNRQKIITQNSIEKHWYTYCQNTW